MKTRIEFENSRFTVTENDATVELLVGDGVSIELLKLKRNARNPSVNQAAYVLRLAKQMLLAAADEVIYREQFQLYDEG